MSGSKKSGKKASKKAVKKSPQMSQNVTGFEWDSVRERAAYLLAENKLTDELIAKECEIDRRTLARWKTHPEFQARVDNNVEKIRETIVKRGIIEKQNRLDALNDRWQRMTRVIEQRATVYAGIQAGGNTGLLVKQIKGIGKGEDFQVVEEYAVDTGLLKEMREHEKQAAQELGEWTEKREVTGKNGEDLFKHVIVEIVDGNKDSDK